MTEPDSPHPAAKRKQPDPFAHFTFTRFFIGLFLGAMISVLLFIRGWHIVKMRDGTPIFTDPFAKILLGFLCLCFPRWRSFAAGILISIIVGLLILVAAWLM